MGASAVSHLGTGRSRGRPHRAGGRRGEKGGSAPGGEGAEGAGVRLKILVRVQMSHN